MTSWICLLVFAATPGSSSPRSSSPEAPRVDETAAAEYAAQSAAISTSDAQKANGSSAPRPSAAGPKSATQLRKDIHESLRSAAVESGPAREAAIRRLLTLYGELARDTQFTEEDRLAALRLVRNRLVKISEELTKAARKSGVNRNPPVAPAAGAKRADEIAASQPPDPIKENTKVPASPARGAGQFPEDGQALLDLIQQTIATQTWEVNGGPGVIRYYASGQALVVRQTGDVHNDLSDVLGQLRK